MKDNKLPYHNSGFKVPPGYFEEFEDRIMKTVSGGATYEEAIKGRAGFTVPKNYFNGLEDKVLEKLEAADQGNKVISIFSGRTIYYFTAVAAVFIAIITTVLFNPALPDYTIESVELSALEEYIDEGYIDLNFNEISAYITEEGLFNENFNTADLSEEDVLIYLNENIEDPNLLYE